MKKYLIITIAVIVLIIIIMTTNNFFNNSYHVSNDLQVYIPTYSYDMKESKNIFNYPANCCDSKLVLKNIRSKAYLDKFISDYIEYLPSCYDESYFYDAKNNVTYNQYIVKSSGMTREINITFQKGNYCENEYVLDDNWINITDASNVTSATFDYQKLLEILTNAKRLAFNSRIPYNEQNSYSIDYVYNKIWFVLRFNVYDKSIIGVTRVDANDASKYAIYDIGKDAEKLLESLLK